MRSSLSDATTNGKGARLSLCGSESSGTTLSCRPTLYTARESIEQPRNRPNRARLEPFALPPSVLPQPDAAELLEASGELHVAPDRVEAVHVTCLDVREDDVGVFDVASFGAATRREEEEA